MSEPGSKPPKTESASDVATIPLGIPARAKKAGSADVQGTAIPEGSGDYETEDPFRFGWHHIDPELMQELAEKPLQRLDDKDKVTTVPPGLGERGRDTKVAAAPEVPAPTPPANAPSPRWRRPMLGAVALATLALGTLWITSSPSPEQADPAESHGFTESTPDEGATPQDGPGATRGTPPRAKPPQDAPSKTERPSEEIEPSPPEAQREPYDARPATKSTVPSSRSGSSSTRSASEESEPGTSQRKRPPREPKPPARTAPDEIDIETPLTGF